MIPGAPRWLALIALTVALAGALWWVDQRVVDEPPPNAWRAFATLDALPPDARVPDPTLLSPSLGWPPAQIWHRPGAGTWLALGAPPRAWLGTWTGDVPAALGPWAACLDDAPGCPDGWQARAAAEPDGWRRAALLQGDAAAADRLFRGLRAASPIK
ncbi:MAG: hypothetical protein H6704_15415 [Myxococcales bacterium]|nr:hypothetical protein [Myxococcales bacterium]